MIRMCGNIQGGGSLKDGLVIEKCRGCQNDKVGGVVQDGTYDMEEELVIVCDRCGWQNPI